MAYIPRRQLRVLLAFDYAACAALVLTTPVLPPGQVGDAYTDDADAGQLLCTVLECELRRKA
jgi:hypothetical protein